MAKAEKTRNPWQAIGQSPWWRGRAGWRRGVTQLIWAAIRLLIGQWLWGTGVRLLFFPAPTRHVGLTITLIAGALVVWASIALLRSALALGVGRLLVLFLTFFTAITILNLASIPGAQVSGSTLWQSLSASGAGIGDAVSAGGRAILAAPDDIRFAYTGSREPPPLPPGFPTPDPQATPIRVVAVRAGEASPQLQDQMTPFQPSPSANAPTPAALHLGGTARIVGVGSEPLRAHVSPGTKPEVVARFAEGTIVTIAGGPQDADGFHWWLVRDEQEREGWCADQWLEPTQ